LRTDYSKKGLYPALDIEKSVSRIGRKAQSTLMSWISNDFKSNLLSYLRIAELLSMGVSVSNEQRSSYNAGLAALGVWNQSKPRFFEDNVLSIIASNLKLICPKNSKKAIIFLLEQTYKNSNYILSTILFHKHLNKNKGNLLFIKKFIVRYFYL
jgi:F0F1-type ATP synthase alpha subunit